MAKAGSLEIDVSLQLAKLQTDINKVSTQLEAATSKWERAFSGLSVSVSKLSIGTAIGNFINQFANAVGTAISSAVNEIDELSKAAKRAGVSFDDWQTWNAVVDDIGVNINVVTGAVNNLNRVLGQVSMGNNKKAAQYLNDLHLSITDLAKLDPQAQFQKIVTALNNVQNSAQRNAIGTTLLGGKYQDLAAVLPDLIQKFQTWDEKLTATGQRIDGSAVKAINDFKDAVQQMQNQTTAFLVNAVAPLLPMITEMVKWIGDLTKNTDLAKIAIEAMKYGLVTFGTTLNVTIAVIEQVTTAVETMADVVTEAFTGLQRIQTIALSLAPYIASPITAALNPDKVKAMLADLEKAVTDTAGRMKAANDAGIVDQDKSRKDFLDRQKALMAAFATSAQDAGNAVSTAFNPAPPEAFAKGVKAANDELANYDIKIAKISQEDIFGKGVQGAKLLQEALLNLKRAQLDANGASEDEKALWELRIQGAGRLANKINEINKETKALTDATQKKNEEQAETARTIKEGVTDIFNTIGKGSDAAKQAIAELIQKLLVAIATAKILAALEKFVPGISTAAKGMAFDLGGVRKFAQGGVVAAPTFFKYAGGTGLMGEAGPEAIVPLQRGAGGRLGVGATPSNIQINNYGSAQVTAEQDGNTIRVMIDQVKQSIAQDVRRGGNSLTGAFERSYGLRR